MPHYYFDLTDGKRVLKAPEGFEFLGDAAAREEASRIARRLRAGTNTPGRDWTGWYISIRDRHAKEVDRIRIDLVPDAPAT